jgi:hypothetical protein
LTHEKNFLLALFLLIRSASHRHNPAFFFHINIVKAAQFAVPLLPAGPSARDSAARVWPP